MRAAKAAAEIMRERLDTPVLCQGDDTTSALVQRFADDAETSLFGTLSLWQGVDVPGPSLSLVLIDRIPFPRPDDPLLTARQRAVAAHGGNGFMAVAASHAALLLAQGAGRLLRRVDDRGVVAVLDSRMATARYGGLSARVAAAVLGDDGLGAGARRARTAARRLTDFTILAANSLSPKGGVHEPTTPGGRRDRGLLGVAGHRLHHDAAGQGRLGVRRPVPCRRDARHRRTHRPAARRARPVREVESTDNGKIDELAANAVSDIEEYWSNAYGDDVRRRVHPGGGADLVGRQRFRRHPFCDEDTYGLVNAAFCFDDKTIGWDRGELLPALRKAYGDMGVTMVLAHEYGHAVQHQAGLNNKNTPTLVSEQQADCFAGAYMRWVAEDNSPRFTLSTGEGPEQRAGGGDRVPRSAAGRG